MQKDGQFSYESFKTFVRIHLQQTPNAFVEEQKKEMLASRVRNLVRSSVSVSPDEVKAEFIRKNRQVNLEYIRFVSRRSRKRRSRPTDEEIAGVRGEERSQAERDLRAEEVLLREGARPAPHQGDPGQAAQRRRREGRQGGAREGARRWWKS